MLLAGDIGGTKALLGLFSPGAARPALAGASVFLTAEHDSLVHIVAEFLDSHGRPPIEAACFGVAGPVREQRAVLTNAPWAIAGAEIAAAFTIPSVSLLND